MKKGFTLIELLITIAIIAILAAMGSAVIPSAQKLARDANRKSDLKQYQTTLENYANKNGGLYPIYATVTVVPSSGGLCTNLDIGTCPLDPTNTSPYVYKYISDASGTNYVIWTGIEKGTSSTSYWILCSTGKNGEATTEPSSATCPI